MRVIIVYTLSDIPREPGCSLCASLLNNPQPGLLTWIEAVGRHMATHDVILEQG